MCTVVLFLPISNDTFSIITANIQINGEKLTI